MNPATPRRPWLAVVLALACNGLGHAYAGSLRAAASVFALWMALAAALAWSLRQGLALAAGAALLALGFWLVQAVLAGVAALTAPPAPRPWHARPLGLAALYLSTFLLSGALRVVLARTVVETYEAPVANMLPTLEIGDWFVLARGAPPERGAVVVHRASGSGDIPQIKRVVAVGGDTVEVRDGQLVLNGRPVERRPVAGPCRQDTQPIGQGWRVEPCLDFVEVLDGRAYHTHCTPGLPCGDAPATRVPAGHVFVLGDRRDRSSDSRAYGPVPVRDVLGRASYVYFSLGPAGVRWERIGKAIR